MKEEIKNLNSKCAVCGSKKSRLRSKWFIPFLIRIPQVGVLKMKLYQMND